MFLRLVTYHSSDSSHSTHIYLTNKKMCLHVVCSYTLSYSVLSIRMFQPPPPLYTYILLRPSVSFQIHYYLFTFSMFWHSCHFCFRFKLENNKNNVSLIFLTCLLVFSSAFLHFFCCCCCLSLTFISTDLSPPYLLPIQMLKARLVYHSSRFVSAWL